MIEDGWFMSLGNPVSPARRRAALELLTAEGLDPTEAALVLTVVAREIEHDKPAQAQQYLRSWLPRRGSETLLLRTLATLCQDPLEETLRLARELAHDLA